MSYSVGIFVIILALCSVALVSSTTYYVAPATNDSCLHDQEEYVLCFTLTEIANKSSDYFASNTTLVLLPGNHSLESVLYISNITSLSITVQMQANSTQDGVTKVTCSESGRFFFQFVDEVSISDVEFIGCVQNHVTGRVTSAQSTFTLKNCIFNGLNKNGTGLVVRSTKVVNILQSSFLANTGTPVSHPFRPWNTPKGGGALILNNCTSVSVSDCHFEGNSAGFGGALFSLDSSVTIIRSTFDNNMAATDGGGVYTARSSVMINKTIFYKNSLTESTSYGGAVEIFEGNSSINDCIFINNTAGRGGGAIDLFNSHLTNHMSNNNFTNNSAPAGSVIIVEATSLETTGYLDIYGNQQGTIFAYNCQLKFTGNIVIRNNTYTNSSLIEQDGGAIICFRSEITFTNTSTQLSFNKAKQGGAIAATESILNFQGNVSITHNNATISGGGIYAYLSELNFWGRATITDNVATKKGGGIHSVGSTVGLHNGSLQFVANSAERGGGTCLALNAKLYILKNVSECVNGNNCFNRVPDSWQRLEYAHNHAKYGGAVFVLDDTISGTCSSNPFSAHSVIGECFLQSLALHPWLERGLNLRNIYFFNNTAREAGNTLYGGLLDRCTASSFAEIFRDLDHIHLNPSTLDAISYFLNLTNIKKEDLQSELSSDPVRVCFCKNNQPDCDYKPPTKFLTKGETFKISLVAVDHVNNTVPNTRIHNSVSNEVGLHFGNQSNKITNENCTILHYNIFSLRSHDQLYLHPAGPCKDGGISQATLQIKFKSCPIGFHDTKMECNCDPILYPEFITNCSIDTESVVRKDSVWISLLNKSSEYGYMIYENCPFDYCHPSTMSNVLVNLNVFNGSDTQCASNRTGKLCGACKDGLSLSLGSSDCTSCSNSWLALLIVFALLGVALVIFILMCNLTVAVGTINGLIFYANIIAANGDIFFPPSKEKAVYTQFIFIAWLNLDFGIKTCFYDGLDGYAKTWLQFAFPLYILLLVLGIVFACHYFPRFAQLLLNRNPVGTLATLILLSYAKLLRTVIAALSFARLQRHLSDGRVETSVVWLIDANVGYFQGKHIPLFFTALFVLIVGLVYTFMLLLWQWFQHLPNRRCFRWVSNSKLNAFMEAYHAPYTKRHRYWTGLLLLVRAVLYLVAALNVVRDSRSTLLSITCVVAGLSFLRNIWQYKVYRKWPLNVLESIFIFNLVILSTATLYVRGVQGNHNALTYTSTSIAFLVFLCILVYHAFTNFKFLRKLQNFVAGKKRRRALTEYVLRSYNDETDSEHSGEFSQLREPLDIFEQDPAADDYYIVQQSATYRPPKTRQRAVTQTVVDIVPDHNNIN